MAGSQSHVAYTNRQTRGRSGLRVRLGRALDARTRRALGVDTSDPAIKYRIADLKTLELPGAAFDLVYSALTFHYVEDLRRLTRMIHQALVPGGDLVFTAEHPIFMAATHPHWIADEDGRKTWPVNGYSMEGERRTDWFAKGVLKHHRTLGTTLNTLIDAASSCAGSRNLPRRAKRSSSCPNWPKSSSGR